jgi:uncharacterized protein (DUF58 family)
MALAQRTGTKLLPIDWGAISPLRIHARTVAEGAYSGAHRSTRRGAGIEFGGQRPYVPGDDLRFLDRRSLLRHDRLMVREFETDTDRAVWLVVDTSASMSFRGPSAQGAKLAYGALLAAATARIALAGHDPVGLAWLGVGGNEGLTPGFGNATFDRIVDALERAVAAGSLQDDVEALDRDLGILARRARRGSVIVIVSDFLDVPDEAIRRIAAVASGRVLCAVQVLDPVEIDLSFTGKVLLRAMESEARVTTDADRVRDEYRQKLEEHSARWRRAIEGEGGRMLRASSGGDAVVAVRGIVQAIAEAHR